MSDSSPNRFKDLVILLLIFYAFGIPPYLSLLLEQNVGMAPLPYMVEITLVFPVAMILAIAALKKRLKLPYFIPFLFTELLFLFFESRLFRSGNIPDLAYPYGILILYSIFLALVNYGSQEEDRHKVSTYAIYSVLFLCITMFLGYIGVLNVSLESGYFSFNELASTRPLGNIIHTNGFSFACCIAIYLLIFAQISGVSSKREKIFWFQVILFYSIIVVNSSLGSFIIVGIGVGAYLIHTWKSRRVLANLAVIYVLLFFLIVVAFPSDLPFLEKFFLYNRIGKEGQFLSRFRQIYVTWVNFVNSPWLGVGYYHAARGIISGYTRSNFHYTQILATNGIVYFPFYIYFLSRMFGFDFRDLKLFLCMTVGFGALMFYNWALIFPLAIIAYVVYCEKNSQEFELQLEISTSGLEPLTPVTNSHSLMGVH